MMMFDLGDIRKNLDIKSRLDDLTINYSSSEDYEEEEILDFVDDLVNQEEKYHINYNPFSVFRMSEDKIYLVLAEVEKITNLEVLKERRNLKDFRKIGETMFLVVRDEKGDLNLVENFVWIKADDDVYPIKTFFEVIPLIPILREVKNLADIDYRVTKTGINYVDYNLSLIFENYLKKLTENLSKNLEKYTNLEKLLLEILD